MLSRQAEEGGRRQGRRLEGVAAVETRRSLVGDLSATFGTGDDGQSASFRNRGSRVVTQEYRRTGEFLEDSRLGRGVPTGAVSTRCVLGIEWCVPWTRSSNEESHRV